MTPETYMQLAVDQALEGIQAGQTPFASLIVGPEGVVAAAHNTVWRDTDPTAHAEVNAIRKAAAVLNRIDLTGHTLYSTCEPCPMCLTAIHWSKIDKVVYGATIADAREAGFSELHLSAQQMTQMGGSPLQVEQGPLKEACRRLFQIWKSSARSAIY